MARPEVTGRKVFADQAAFTIAEFCKAHRISQSMYFKLRNLGLGPREMAVGSRRLISQEAAAKWRKAREAAADQATEVRGNGVTVSPSRSPATWSSIRPPRCAARPDGARPRVHRLRHRPSQGGPNRRLTPLSAHAP